MKKIINFAINIDFAAGYQIFISFPPLLVLDILLVCFFFVKLNVEERIYFDYFDGFFGPNCFEKDIEEIRSEG